MNDTNSLETPAPSGPSYLDNPWLVVTMLFLVTGALGIPVLWASRAFSVSGKLLLTVLVSFYTACICGMFWLVLMWAYQQIVHALGFVVAQS